MSYRRPGDAAQPARAHTTIDAPDRDPGFGTIDPPRGDSVVPAQQLLGGRYLVERLLGSGGMGTVWRGHDLRLDRPVAIKLLSGDALQLPNAMERFDREARAVARLSHPNIVPVHDFGTQDGHPFLVMELVDGPTAADLSADRPPPIADVLAIAAQVCDGLTAAHAAGIVHRDIKPSNLIMTATGVVKICDFGVARMLDTAEPADLTGSAIAMGSPKYMSPEQITGDPVDARTDLYGLGCSMYAMLTGRPPFSTGPSLSVIHQHLTKAPEPLHVRRPDVPPDLEALVADLLAKTPDARPPDAATVRARILAMADAMADGVPAIPGSAVPPAMIVAARDAHEPNASAPPTLVAPPDHDRRPPAPRRWPWAVAGAVAAALVLTAFIAAVATMNPSGSQHVAQPLAPAGSHTGGPAPSATAATGASTPEAATAPATQPPPSPTASAPPPPPPSPVDPVLALRQAIQQHLDAADLKADTAKDLNHMVDDLVKAITTANPGDDATKLKALRDKLTALHKDNRLTDAAYADLNSRLDMVAAQIG